MNPVTMGVIIWITVIIVIAKMAMGWLNSAPKTNGATSSPGPITGESYAEGVRNARAMSGSLRDLRSRPEDIPSDPNRDLK